MHNKHHLAGLDHLRALAITLVLLYHYRSFGHPDWIDSNLVGFGWTGVDLFFVLSGFLIASQLFSRIQQDKPILLKAFFIKRFFRIIPPYLVVLSLYLAFPFLREREHLASLTKYLTFTLNFGLDLRHTGTFTHAWSLCIEEQFYLLLPLLIIACQYFNVKRNAIYLLLLAWLLSGVLRAWNWWHYVAPAYETDTSVITWYKYLYYPTYTRLDGLLMGVGLAALFTFYPNVKNIANAYSNSLLLAGLLLLIIAYFICQEPTTFTASVYGFPLVAIAYGCWVAAAACPACFLYQMQSKFTARLAFLSYAIYLLHKMIIHVIQSQIKLEVNSYEMFLLCLAGAIAGAILMRILIENPCLAIRNRVLSKQISTKFSL
ncbi:acyltransferase [Mucilaginibacter robiniae]|uniref:Acyltransferase n=1 Tax=Mucilaginibacter robiniae TaxID=2728022 RepID=A0A7L5E698_9SPHI|nr:acyltransferase [Mucilaginibacter robiniae]QJD95906.1 acyltransferase [Mucilaginibacter robiniae]